jgi:hypothetical protein
MGEKGNAYRLLVERPEEKIPLGRQRHRWVDNIRMVIVEIVLGELGWTDLAQDRYSWRALVNSAMNIWIP